MKKKQIEKEFEVDIEIKWTQYGFARTKQEAVKRVLESFYDEYGIELDKKEVKAVREVKKL